MYVRYGDVYKTHNIHRDTQVKCRRNSHCECAAEEQLHAVPKVLHGPLVLVQDAVGPVRDVLDAGTIRVQTRMVMLPVGWRAGWRAGWNIADGGHFIMLQKVIKIYSLVGTILLQPEALPRVGVQVHPMP